MVNVVDADLSDLDPSYPLDYLTSRWNTNGDILGPFTRFDCARRSEASTTLIMEGMSRIRASTLFHPPPLLPLTPG